MIIIKNEFSPVDIYVPLIEIGLDEEKLLDTTGEIGGGILDTIYVPIADEDKFLSIVKDMVDEISVINGYSRPHWGEEMSEEEIEKECPNVFPIAYKAEFDIEYISDGQAELQIWIKPQNPDNEEHLPEHMVLESVPVELNDEELKYLLKICVQAISIG